MVFLGQSFMYPKLPLNCYIAKDYLELLSFLLPSLDYECWTKRHVLPGWFMWYWESNTGLLLFTQPLYQLNSIFNPENSLDGVIWRKQNEEGLKVMICQRNISNFKSLRKGNGQIFPYVILVSLSPFLFVASWILFIPVIYPLNSQDMKNSNDILKVI